MHAKKKRRRRKKDASAEGFARALTAFGVPDPVRELKFHDTRAYRFDLAWPDEKVAVEIHGGTTTGGRHVTPQGMISDSAKNNLAIFLGWRVLVFPTTVLGSEQGRQRAVSIVAALLNGDPPPWHLAMTEKQAEKEWLNNRPQNGLFT